MTRSRLAWMLAALTWVGGGVDTFMTMQSGPLLSEQIVAQHGWPFITAACVACSTTGALILSRYPRHLIGWLLVATGVIGETSMVCEIWSIWILDWNGPGSTGFGHLIGWVSALTSAQAPITMLCIIFLTAPDGRLPSRRWRWVARLTVLGFASYTAGVFLVGPSGFDITIDQDFPLVPTILSSTGILVLLASLIACLVALVRRLRSSTGVLRQQLRWITAAAAMIPLSLIWLLAGQIITQSTDQHWSDSLPLFLSYLLFPVSVAVAVLRYRLYDIDVIINRAVLLAVSTGFVAAGYIAIVVLIGGNANGVWTPLLATAIVAMAFQPLRVRAVRLADRLAYGARAVPYESLADFSRRLGESSHPAALLPAVAEAAAEAVAAQRTIVTLYVDSDDDEVAVWPRGSEQSPGVSAVGIPVLDRGERLGSIAVEMPVGRGLRPSDVRLLEDLALQAALAFRNARLTAELAAQVDQLHERTTELAESRRRLITAGDAERSRLERSLARDVVPHLEPLPATITALASTPGGRLAAGVPALLEASAAALEALREITRGVYPAQLVRAGLAPALTSYLGRFDPTAALTVDPTAAGRRFDPAVEAAAYFSIVESLPDLTAPITISLTAPDGQVVLRATGGEGVELAPSAVDHVRDRVEAAGGTVTAERLVTNAVREVVLEVRLPDQPPAELQAALSRSGPKADLVT